MSPPPPPAELLQRLSKARQTGDRSVLVVVGSGVSVEATNNAPAASWSGLLAAGLACVDRMPKSRRPRGWDTARLQQILSSRSAPSLIEAATEIEAALRRAGAEVYKDWLLSMFGDLAPAKRELYDALSALGVPLATTNYDGLIEYALLRQGVTWRDHVMVDRFLDNDLWRETVLHLHGHYREPASVVLGIPSYEKLLTDFQAQGTLRKIFRSRDLIFVGVGSGLEDPNFGKLLDWACEVGLPEERKHWLLVRTSDVPGIIQRLPRSTRIAVQSYGDTYGDLSPFLRALLLSGSTSTAVSPAPAALAAFGDPPGSHAIAAAQQSQHIRTIQVSGSHNQIVISQQTAGPPAPAASPQTLSSPVPPVAPKPARRRATWSALLMLDREAQYSRIRDTAHHRARNRLILLHGKPEQRMALFVRRLEEYLHDDAGFRVVNVAMRQNDSRASSAAAWSLHLKHALEEDLGDSGRSVADMLREIGSSSPVLISLVAVDNPLQPLGVLSPEQMQGLKDFVSEALPKHLAGLRRVAVLVAIEHRTGDTHLLSEVTAWAEAAWHTDERSHTILPELKRPSWEEVADYLRSYSPPLRNLATILQEAETAYHQLRPEATFEDLAQGVDDLVSRLG